MRKLVVLGLSLLLVFVASPLASAQGEEAAIYTTTMNYQVTNNGSFKAENVRMIIFLFDNISGWADQTVLSENIDGVTFLSEIESTDDNRWVRISFGDLQAGESKTAAVTQTIKVKAVDFSIDPSNVDNSFPQELIDNFTSAVDGLFESNNSTIQALAQQLTENTTNPYYMARQIFDFVLEDPQNEQDLSYEHQTVEHSALWALQAKVGDCTEFSNLFVALLRAAGIPAKTVSGYGYNTSYNPTPGPIGIDNLPHAYPIFYLPKKTGEDYGWVPADAVWPRYTGSFCKLDYGHLAGGNPGGDGIVQDGNIRWPNPGIYKDPKYTHYEGQETSVEFSSFDNTITPEVYVDVTLQYSTQIQDDVLTFTTTIKNMGQSTASNLTAELENVDQTYFEVLTSAQQKDSLASDEEWATTFQVRLEEGAYDKTHTFTSKITYESSYDNIGGTFLATGDQPVPIAAKPATPQQGLIVPQEVQDFLLYALIGVLVGAIAAAGIALARGRKSKIVRKRRMKSD